MSLKDRLAARARPSVPYRLRVDDDTRAQAELAAARATGDADRIALARDAVRTCYEQVTIRALQPGPSTPPDPDVVDMETLLAAHPPTEEQRDKNRRVMFNPRTFPPAFLAVSVETDPVITAEEWAVFTTSGAMTTGEVQDLFNTAWNLNHRAPDPDVGKG